MKNTILYGCKLICLILSFVFMSTCDVNAIVYFTDDFSTNNLEKWTQDSGNIGETGSWFISDDGLHGKVASGKYSHIYANNFELPLTFLMEATVKNISGVDQQFLFNVSANRKNYYLVGYRYNESGWSQDNNNIVVYKFFDGGYRLLGRYPSEEFPRKFNLTQDQTHKVEVAVSPTKIKVAFDGNLVIDTIDYDGNFYHRGSFGLMNWGGDFPNITENIYRKITISSDAFPKNKVIILPGLGASWNPEAILLNSTAPSLQWSMTPFVKNYDLLEKALEDNNYTKNQDYFVWNYDWRKPLASIVSDFNNYVESLNLNEGERINLVGHSLGGLTARLWAQDHQNKVNQIISLGSPHYGTVKAYEAWNGAKISDSVDFSSIALNVLLQLQKKNNNSSVETLRNYAPIIKDLIPTFPFLKKNGTIVATASKNQYLLDKNSVISSILGQMNSIAGIGVTTKEWINLSERSLFDKVLGIWDEGRASSYVYGAGDGTVLKKSALIPASRMVEINSKHGELPDKSINLVLNTLGLGITVNSVTNYPQKQAVFYLGSPATMKVDCNGIVKDEIGGWVVIENRESKGCKVFLKGKDGGGTYHLVVGDESGWNYFESSIVEAEEKQITIGSVESNWLVLRDDLNKLGATQAVVAAESRDILKTIEAYMNFRVLKKDFRYSEEVIEKMRLILNERQVTAAEIQKWYYAAMGDKSVVESNLRLMARSGISPKYSAALTDYQAESLMSLGKNYAANYLADKLYKIVWK